MTVVAFVQDPGLPQDSAVAELLAEDESQLIAALGTSKAKPSSAPRPDGLDTGGRKKVIEGARNSSVRPGGTRRACARVTTRGRLQLSTATVEARWRRLQLARRHEPARPIRCSSTRCR